LKYLRKVTLLISGTIALSSRAGHYWTELDKEKLRVFSSSFSFVLLLILVVIIIVFPFGLVLVAINLLHIVLVLLLLNSRQTWREKRGWIRVQHKEREECFYFYFIVSHNHYAYQASMCLRFVFHLIGNKKMKA